MGYPKEYPDDNIGYVQLYNVLRIPKALWLIQENIIRKWAYIRSTRGKVQENSARIN